VISPRLRTAGFAIANVAVLLAAAVGSMSTGASAGRAVYASLLFALCSAPVLLLDNLNGRFALLAIFMALYFVFFGALDLLSLIFGADLPVRADFLSAGECGILLGALLAILGYVAAARPSSAYRLQRPPADWSKSTIVVVGLLLWILGSASLVYFQVFVLNEKTNVATTRGLASLGPGMTFVVLLGNLVQPLGVLLLAYGYARFRTMTWLALILAVVSIQVVIGFVSDIKSSAMLAGILVILAKTLVDNRLPKAWIVGSALFLAVAFPVFQAYRAEVAGERGMTRTEAARDLAKVIEISLASRDKVASGHNAERSQSFFERASVKGNAELAFDHTGIDTPFQNGRTLLDLPFAFIPRLIWPNKPGVPAGQLFNKEFTPGGDPDTFISPSHLGELYWNFGWLGVIVGMTSIGAMLGAVGAKSNLAERMSMTRMLVLIATIKGVCLDFEGSIAVGYVVWLRSLAAIGILHLLFARHRSTAPAQEPQATDAHGADTSLQLADRFPNLMR
jgi:hypothetical protein